MQYVLTERVRGNASMRRGPTPTTAPAGCHQWRRETFEPARRSRWAQLGQASFLPGPLMTTPSIGRCPFSAEIAVSWRVSSTPMSTRT
jgi:hypothetical protein